MLNILALLALVLLAAKALAGYAQSRKVPPILAELGVGILLGNLGGWPGYQLAALESSDAVRALSELGVLFLLFQIGLETKVAQVLRVGREALMTAVIGVLAPIALALVGVHFLFSLHSFPRELFVASALCATSVGVAARVFRDLGVLDSASGQIVLGAAVIDDVLGVVILAVAGGLAMQGGLSWSGLGLLILKILAFGGLIFALRQRHFADLMKKARRFETPGMVVVVLLGVCILMSWTAEKLGLTGILGAFAIGILFGEGGHFRGYQETSEGQSLSGLLKPVTDFVVPIFFVMVGMSVKLRFLLSWHALALTAVLMICAFVGKLACALAVDARARRQGADRWLVAIGMLPRGEVGLIFASVGLRAGVLDPGEYGALVGMVVATTLAAPLWIARRSAVRAG